MTEKMPLGPTAGLLIIGNEILSGQVQDINIKYLTKQLRNRGIAVEEVRIVRDEEQAIINALHGLRGTYTYVFTTGGIGPTHDDVTSLAVAKAFGVPCVRHSAVQDLFVRFYPNFNIKDDPRLRMADLPEGCELLPCPISLAPGFRFNNVFVLAGVPSIMESMFETLASSLTPGPRFYERGLFCRTAESRLAHPLEEIQNAFGDVEIGSYPTWEENDACGVIIMFKGRTLGQIEAALTGFRHHQNLQDVLIEDI